MAFIKVKLADVMDNVHRDANVYQYDPNKISALKDHIADTGYWENVLARKTKEGKVQLAYGHHRMQALRELVAEGLIGYEEIRINVRPESELTDEKMLKIFAQENSDEWGEDARNGCMTMLQVKAHLENILLASSNKDEFIKKIGSIGALKVDDRSFTRMKNDGVGASTIAQFLGGAFSRQTVQDAMALIKSDKATFELAKTLPGITLANRFQRLITKEKTGKGEDDVMYDEKVQKKVADKILKMGLSRAEVEDALKIVKGQEEADPVAAIEEVIEKKKGRIKKAKEEVAALRPAPKEPVEKVLAAMEKVLETVRRERVNLKDEDIERIKLGWPLIVEALDTVPEEIADAEASD